LTRCRFFGSGACGPLNPSTRPAFNPEEPSDSPARGSSPRNGAQRCAHKGASDEGPRPQGGRTWAIVLDIGPDAHGKRRQKWHSGFATKREAEAALTELLGKLQDRNYVEPSRLTLGSYVTGEWLPAVRRRVRPSPKLGMSAASESTSCLATRRLAHHARLDR
jgi:hypothetical protein